MTKTTKTVLITGASSGIGYELSKMFAQNGFHLVLVARNLDKLNSVADEIIKLHHVPAKIIQKDLSAENSPEEIYEQLKGENIDIDVLVNNAGFQVYGKFFETDLSQEVKMIQTNVIALVKLTKLFLKDMVASDSGKILNIGSTGSFVPGPLNSIYCASKAFVLSFTEAINEELTGSNVSVTALCPGPTATEFAKRADIENTRIFSFGVMDAKKVAEKGYVGLMKGKRIIMPGILNKIQIFLTRLTPRFIMVKVVKFEMER